MNDNPTLEELLGKNEATRLVAMSRAFGQALDTMFFGRKSMEEKRTCKTCNEIQSNPEATLSTCNYCGDQTCFTCLDTGRHAHDGRLEAIAFIFCLPCEKVQPISSKTDDKPCCSVCKFEWAPRAIIGGDSSNKGQAICSFCGALQTYMTLPFHCGKCASRLL